MTIVVSDEVFLLRLVIDEERFIPQGARFPNSIAIEPSSDDKAQASVTGKPVRVSAWDLARTTPSQAIVFRRTTKRLRGYRLAVADVSRIRRTFKNEDIRVVEDPMPEYLSEPGGEGHCGIEGLDRRNTPRPSYRNLLDELARHLVETHLPATPE